MEGTQDFLIMESKKFRGYEQLDTTPHEGTYRRVAINLMHQIRADRSIPTSQGYDQESVDLLATKMASNKNENWWTVINNGK